MTLSDERPGSAAAAASWHRRVFVSYAHDSERHIEQVVRFCRFLREVGVDARLDQWAESSRRDWSTWANEQMEKADFVLVVASPAYKQRAADQVAPNAGRGVQFEAALIREKLFADRDRWLPRVLPVVLPGLEVDDIPSFLQPRSASHYRVTSFTVAGAEQLLRVLTAQPLSVRPELGPVPELQQILTEDAGLPTSVIGESRPATTSIVDLPRQPAYFTGRDGELDQLLAALRPPGGGKRAAAPPCVIHGMAGVGKTALAVHAAAEIADVFADGCLFIDLHGYSDISSPVPAADALDRLLRRLGVPGTRIPRHVDDRSALYRRVLAGRRVLVVLDNARSAAHVRPLLPNGPGCGVLITSRDRLIALDDAQLFFLDVLSEADAMTLFTSVVGPERLQPAATSDKTSRIVHQCGRLPLAVRIAAARYRASRMQTLHDLVRRLDDEHRRLPELDDGERSVAASLAVSYIDLRPPERKIFALLAIHPGADFDAHAVAALAGSPTPAVERSLYHLTDRSLLIQHTHDRYRFHDLVRTFAHQHALPDIQQHSQSSARRRLIDYYLHVAEQADVLITPHRHRIRLDIKRTPLTTPDLDTYDDALAWLATELPNLIDACRIAATHGLHAQCWQLAYTLRGFFFLTKRWDPWQESHELALAATRRLGDRRAAAMTLNSLGLAAIEQGHLDTAADCYQQALCLFQEVGDPHGEHTALANHAWILYYQQRYTDFLRDSRRALAFYERDGNHRNAAITLRGIALAEIELGQPTDAIRHLKTALGVFDQLGLRLDATMALNGLGEANARAGDPQLAVDWHRRAARSAQECGSTFESARAHHRLGQLAADGPNPDTGLARHHLTQALTQYETLGAPQVAEVRATLADLGRPPVL
jgi:tetratricopeptide (TPR) repeat protein